MKIKTNQKFRDLKGKVIENNVEGDSTPLTLGTILADVCLVPHQKKGFRPLKGYELAKKFTDREMVEIDSADYIQIKEILENTEFYSTLIIAQTLQMLEDSKESKK